MKINPTTAIGAQAVAPILFLVLIIGLK